MATTFDLIKESFADYLSKPYWDWSWYVTQTFDPDRHPDYPRLAEHSWRFFLSRLSENAIISYGFVFAEPHKNGRMHWHALVHVTENIFCEPRRNTTWDSMFQKYGYCQILPYDSRAGLGIQGNAVCTGVARYLTKYVAKEAARDHAWWDFGGNMSGKPADAAELRAAIGAPSCAVPGF